MRFWWVNQNQTWRQEVGGGYLWSPKRETNSYRFIEYHRDSLWLLALKSKSA